MNLTETKNGWVLKGKTECQSCKGTGLYVGMAENDGAAVICYDCEGEGFMHVTDSYPKFTERKKKKSVKRVFKTAGGYGISGEDITNTKGERIRFSQFGVPYDEWLNGGKPKPIEDLHCPYMHTSQTMQDKDHQAHKLYKERCSKKWFNYIPDCQHYKSKDICWKRYHELTGE